jgi:ribonuclease D
VAAARLAQARKALGEFAETHHIPVENVLSPDFLRRMLWSPQQLAADGTLTSISAALLTLGARQWQIDIAGPIIEEAVNRPATPAADPAADGDDEEVT